jgi:membrane protease YdiL (CAAX protease family)
MIESICISLVVLAIIFTIMHFGGLTGMIVAVVIVALFHIGYRIKTGHWLE